MGQRLRADRRSLSLTLGVWAALAESAAAHEFSTHVIGPSGTWCEELAAVAAPADVVQLLPGTYPGGCELAVGGLPELNEALLVSGFGDEPVVIEADDDGLSLRVTGATTRLLALDLRGRLEIAADHVTVDTCAIDALRVDPAVTTVTVLYSEVPSIAVYLDSAVIRGNRVDELDVLATSGLVADNAVRGPAWSGPPFHRNVVLGELRAYGDAFANVLAGDAEVDGRFSGNTALAAVIAGDARNNLTTQAALDPASGNLRCPECLFDAAALDVRPRGAALDALPVESEGDRTEFCGRPRVGVGAVGGLPELDGRPWTAFDRTRAGCVEGASFTPPTEEPPPFVETSPVHPRRACSTHGAGGAWALGLLALRRRTRRWH